MSKKLKILVWSDSVLASTGFGVVSKHVLKELHKTGKYEIHQLAINYYGEFFDQTKYPYQLSPAKLLDPNDPFGNKMLIRALQREGYDLLWILNDTFVVNGVVDALQKVKEDRRIKGLKIFKTIYYYPVDCTILGEHAKMISFADASVCITDYGKQETVKNMNNLNKEIEVIYHGCDTTTFKVIDRDIRDHWRAKYLGVTDPNTFIFINVNRNSVRKDIPRSIKAFKEFKKLVPNSMYYIHCAAKDNNIDLIQCGNSLGLSLTKDLIFPARFNLSDGGFPDDILNQFYNCADAFFTTTLGEGWGLTTTEAMCAGIPVIAPNNTSTPEILGSDLDRGYVYDCHETTWIDNSGYRPLGRMEDIVAKMMEAYENKGTSIEKGIVNRATAFTQKYTWEAVCKDWVQLFNRVESTFNETTNKISTEVV